MSDEQFTLYHQFIEQAEAEEGGNIIGPGFGVDPDDVLAHNGPFEVLTPEEQSFTVVEGGRFADLRVGS